VAFAEVYSATAEQPERNGSAPERVALKVVKRGMDSREIVSRFRAEHRTLQSLAHSSIVQVFETGLTDAGLPYFVMAQVDGVPVTDYCEAAKLSIRARLQLFLKFCEAVQHAHQKGILHRDLKPSNILVEETPEGPMPKVIDFGVARALEPVGSGETLVTQLGQVLGTPTYMSPEQAAGDDAADTRGDIYSLGAVLYEMLSGCPPFDVATLSRLSPMQWARHLHETTPPLPSTKLRQQGGTADCVARLRGDLDDVVRKAIAPDPDQRYASAAALAEDVQHWLDDRPVAAHPPSIHYVVRKFVERHRWPVAVAVSILAGIVATAGIGTVLAIRARASEANALIEKDRALAAEAEARQGARAFRSPHVSGAHPGCKAAS
jgi:serine/threonine protein kinase